MEPQGRLLRWRVATRWERAEELGRRPRHDGYCVLERRLRSGRRAGSSAHLADVLSRRGLDLLLGRGWLQSTQDGDVAAHRGLLVGRGLVSTAIGADPPWPGASGVLGVHAEGELLAPVADDLRPGSTEEIRT
jgi:hypothetical protein